MTQPTHEEYFSQFGAVETTTLSKFQQVVARRLTQSWTQIPHVTHHDDVDITALETHRQVIASEGKVSPLIFLAKALALCLKEFPQFNASLMPDGKAVLRKSYCHIGIAVDGPHGLLVPVLRDVDAKNIRTLAAELIELSAMARGKGLPMSAMEGGSITITSLGAIGGTAFTPIINQPEVAILGVTQSRVQAVWDGTTFQPRTMMPLSLSYDHRVINGADAARFVQRIGTLIGDPGSL